jgi:PAS domain S-box-containing protein
LWIVIGSSGVLFAIAAAYVFTARHSHQRILSAELRELERVKASEEKYRSLFENSLAGIMRIQSEEWKIVDSNAALLAMFGVNDRDGLQSCILKFWPSVLEAKRESLARDGVVEQHEIETTRLDGKALWLLFSAKLISAEQTIQAVVVDITERKMLESFVLRAQKTESLALLTGGLAHDLQNVLAPIDLSVGLLKKRMHGKSNRAVLRAIERSTHEGLELVESILTYGRGTTGERKPVNVGRLVEGMLRALRRGLGSNIRLERDLRKQRWFVMGDAGQLRQVIQNLLVNARDAMRHGGVLLVEARDLRVKGLRVSDSPIALDGRYVRVRVSDTGGGIPPEILDRIFEPFFTTKGDRGGTGLGLSVAQGIVKSHGGFITVSSKIQEGTSLSVYLPVLDGKTLAGRS